MQSAREHLERLAFDAAEIATATAELFAKVYAGTVQFGTAPKDTFRTLMVVNSESTDRADDAVAVLNETAPHETYPPITVTVIVSGMNAPVIVSWTLLRVIVPLH